MRHLPLLIILCLSILLSANSISALVPIRAQVLPPHDYIERGLEALNITELRRHVETLCSFGTRFTGYPGCERAAEYIVDQFKSYGIKHIELFYYNITVPVDEGAFLELPNGEKIRLYPLLPNLVCPPQTPPKGIMGDLVYVGEGTLTELNGKKIENNIVLMDFNSQYHWLTVAKYGAKAVIFIEPRDTSMMEAFMKVLDTVAFNFPRLYVRIEDAKKLLELMKKEDTLRVRLVSNMKWRRVTAKNIIAYLPGSEYPDKYVLLTAAYDSYSVIPSLAPGAREAIGIAVVLQLAKYFATHPGSHKYTLVFIAFSGTDQGVIGARWFVKRYIDENWENWGKKVVLQMNFDINDVGRYIMPTINMGWLIYWHEGVAPWADQYIKWLFDQVVPDIAEKLNMPELIRDPLIGKPRVIKEMFAAGGPGFGITWWDALGSPLRYGNSEPLALLGGPGFTWYNYLAFCKYYYTTFDLPENINWENVKFKLRVVYPVVYATVNVDLSKLIGSWEPAPPQRYYPKWVDVEGRIVTYNTTKGWYDPVPNAIVTYSRGGGSGAGLVSYQRLLPCYEMSDEDGRVFLPGLIQAERVGGYSLRAYVINETTGNVLYAPGFGTYWYPGTPVDVGQHCSSGYSAKITGKKLQTFGSYTLFKCASIILFDIGDIYVRGASFDSRVTIIANDFVAHAPLDQWSWDVYIYGGHGVSIIALFVPPGEKFEIIVQTTYTLRYPMMILTNSTENTPEGNGFLLKEAGEQYVLTYTLLRVAEDLYRLNEKRNKVLVAKNMPIYEAPHISKLLKEAWQALKNCDYEHLEALQDQILVLERERYVTIRSTIEDAVYAITFFGLTIVPFAILAERFIVQARGLRRIIAIILCYMIPLATIWVVHPGFALATNAIMVVIGFLIVVLISPLFGTIINLFIEALRRIRRKIVGVHEVEISRFGVALLGISTGISYMRKRRLISTLSLLSIVFVTMGMVMFTSMSAIRFLGVEGTNIKAIYDGILVHQWTYSYAGFSEYSGLGAQSVPQVGERLLNELKDRLGDKALIAPRAWAYIGQILKGTYLTDKSGTREYRTPIIAILGMTPEECNVTHVDKALLKGTWFTKEMEDKCVAVISESVASALNITIGDEIMLSGYPFKVVGIVNDTAFFKIKDLDDLEITPMDTRLPGYGARIRPHEIIIVPYKTALSNFKAMVVSVAIRFKPEYAKEDIIFNIAKELYNELKIPLYIGLGGRVYNVSSKTTVEILGWQQQVVPLILAALVVLNIMLSSIEERKREISILSSLGLSPFHVSFLFLGEIIVYAVVGGVIGYLAGMVLSAYGGIALRLNYASLTVVWAVTAIMAAILCSSFLPLYHASRLVTPSLERKWKVPKPKGDEWIIMLPFSVIRDREADGVLAYIYEMLIAHKLEDSPVFRTISSIKYEEQKEEAHVIRSLVFDSALAPYDLGITQTVRFSDIKDLKERRHYFQLHISRRSGPRSSWTTFGREFIDAMRKQVMLWRSFKPEDRENYIERFRKEFMK